MPSREARGRNGIVSDTNSVLSTLHLVVDIISSVVCRKDLNSKTLNVFKTKLLYSRLNTRRDSMSSSKLQYRDHSLGYRILDKGFDFVVVVHSN